ncbi:Metalloendopeptidase [Operophtera brumata]|uniref:Metalloendopeptidase n=1 Tax=Operophtera brumata TaxID=104452 RepID=A0A0L7LAN0_OPEBR|nr:Metalloendopeptidase [Operophtera brumata]
MLIDVKTLASKTMKYRTICTDGSKVNWLKIKCLRFEKALPGVVQLRCNYDGPYLTMDTTSKQGRGRQTRSTPAAVLEASEIRLEKAYKQALPISEAKKKEMLNLCKKNIIPEELHPWYESLPSTSQPREVCLKFFDTPPNYAPTVDNKVLYITNPDKRKNCPPDTYNYTGSVVCGALSVLPERRSAPVGDTLEDDMRMSRANEEYYKDKLWPLGVLMYGCGALSVLPERRSAPVGDTLEDDMRMSRANEEYYKDKLTYNFINTHYHRECGALSVLPERRSAPVGDTLEDDMRMSRANEEYYKDKLWPLGVLMYGVEARLRNSEFHLRLKYAMATIELASCVVFQEVESDAELRTRSLLWFVSRGGEAPHLGFLAGNQSVSLASMAEGAPGHVAHALSMLLRALGLPMQSNRHDRDYYVTVTWNNVLKGKEHYLERAPAAAWLSDSLFPYDFYSAAHAPANYMCRACSHGETTLQPAQAKNKYKI